MSTSDEQTETPVTNASPVPWLVGGASAAVLCPFFDFAFQWGASGLLIGGLGAGAIGFFYGPRVEEWMMQRGVPATKLPSYWLSQVDWKRLATPPQYLDNVVDAERSKTEQPDEEPEVRDEEEAISLEFDETDEDIELPSFGERKITVFSDLLKTGWRPAMDKIYAGTDTKGRHLFVPADKLCHVALAGATGHGKSSLMRLIMAQLCYLRLPVILLNPHYMIYDHDHDEHWTPYTPYLKRDPMACKDVRNIEIVLRWMAGDLLEIRKERCSRGEKAGKPCFFILDEYPDIKAEIEDAPELVGKILRQGRKYNIFLIIASQNYDVKTLGVEGEGGVRGCFHSIFYVGGDPVSVKELLNKKVSEIPENDLGQGTIILKCATIKDPLIVHVPYLDNDSLYLLLGPTTFVPGEEEVHTEDLPIVDSALESDSIRPGGPSSSSQSESLANTEPLSNEQDESPDQSSSSSSSLPDGWTEEEAIAARILKRTVKDNDKIINLLDKKGTISRLREQLKQVLGQGEMV